VVNYAGNAASAQSTAINAQTNQPIKSLVQTVNLVACKGLTLSAVFANDDDINAGFIIANVKRPVVSFRAAVQGTFCPNLDYKWDFGDGNTDTTATPTHLYPNKVRDYIVALTVNCTGCSTSFSTLLSFSTRILKSLLTPSLSRFST